MLFGIICGDRWHPADTVMRGMGSIMQLVGTAARLEPVPDAGEGTSANIHRYAAMVMAKSNSKSPQYTVPWLTDEIQQSFVQYVEQGGGLLMIHAGTVGYRNDPLFLHLVGGVFTHHPEPCEVHLMNTDRPAPWSASSDDKIQSFSIFDEHYFVELVDDTIDIFLTSQSKHGVQPAGWTRRQGKGRVCVLTPGHDERVWSNAQYQQLLQQALLWCAGDER